MPEASPGGRQPPILIVGAGPAGLFAACELARHGIASRVVEQRPAPHRNARATAIQPAGLELLARAGVLAPFLERSVHVRRTRFVGPGFQEVGVSSFAGIGCAHEYQCSLPQWQTEATLLDHFHGLGGRIERGVTVLSVEDAADGLRVALRRPDGQVETTWVRFLLGAGGARSITRRSMNEALDGQTYAGRFLVADLCVDVPHEPETSMLFVAADGFVLLAPLPENRWICFISLGDEASLASFAEAPELHRVGAVLNRRIGADVRARDMRLAAPFNMHKRMAPRLADSRRFLMGDAARLSSPIGGGGLNSALMDAADIAWKLALVLRGAGLPSLLDSYAVERGLAGRRVLEVSDALHRRVAGLVDACAGAGLVPPAGPPDPARAVAQARARAMLDVSYAGSPLVGERIGSGVPRPDGPAPGERFPDRIRLAGTSHHLLIFGKAAPLNRLRARWDGLVSVGDGAAMGFSAARAGVPGGGAVLVRPDGFVGFRAVPANAAGLEALDAHLRSYLAPR